MLKFSYFTKLIFTASQRGLKFILPSNSITQNPPPFSAIIHNSLSVYTFFSDTYVYFTLTRLLPE